MAEEFVMLIASQANGEPFDKPHWLVNYDPDAHAPGQQYPTGMVETSPDVQKAMRFKSHPEAWKLWNTQSRTVPLRPDGRPNKPLTAFTVSIVPMSQVKTTDKGDVWDA